MSSNKAGWQKSIEKVNTIVVIFAMVIVLFCYLVTRDDYKSFNEITTEIQPITVATLADGSSEYFLMYHNMRVNTMVLPSLQVISVSMHFPKAK